MYKVGDFINYDGYVTKVERVMSSSNGNEYYLIYAREGKYYISTDIAKSKTSLNKRENRKHLIDKIFKYGL